jgi:hypothetical protein
MKTKGYLMCIVIILVVGSCITQFVPETGEAQELLVVEGLITDQHDINTVKLSKTQSINSKVKGIPYKGCTVKIMDDLGNIYSLNEKSPGTYVTNTTSFLGVIGRKYKLSIRTNNPGTINYTYESDFVEMLPVPSIDTLYYEKIEIREPLRPLKEGCQVYIDSHDPENKCKFYRWDFTETWMFQLPYRVSNRTCWISENSSIINVKNTSVLSEDIVSKYPLYYISPKTDRLSKKYSILLNQYSINENEFDYWQRLQSVNEDVGSLYDITPSFIPGNVTCMEDPFQNVLGYFSVSAKASKRFYITDNFSGLVDLYSECVSETVSNLNSVKGLNKTVWVIDTLQLGGPPVYVLTTNKNCADCTTRGTNIKPSWWQDAK